jgi:predicted TPR repeat methyltransferase/Tfp pilus assembly protein PilF
MNVWENIDDLMLKGDLEEAVSLLHAQPTSKERRYRELLITRQNNNPKELLGLIEDSLTRYPEFAPLYALMALFQHEKGDIETAVIWYKKSLAKDTQQPMVWSNYGLALSIVSQDRSAIEAFEMAISQASDCEAAWFNKGIVHGRRQEYEAAIQSFKVACDLSEDPTFSIRMLGSYHLKMGQFTQASMYFQHLADLAPDEASKAQILEFYSAALSTSKAAHLDENDLDAERLRGVISHRVMETLEDISGLPDGHPSKEHILDGIHGRVSHHPPEGYIESLFDKYAMKYESHLRNVLSYQVPELVGRLVTKYSLKPKTMLDLGCGTGLCSDHIESPHRVGIDVSHQMLRYAKERNTYQALHLGDLTTVCSELSEKFDLVVAGDVFVYIGRLDELMIEIGRILNSAGHVIFSTESSAKADYHLSYTGRYQHSSEYIQQVTLVAGLSLIEKQAVQLRREEGRWVKGDLWIFRGKVD